MIHPLSVAAPAHAVREAPSVQWAITVGLFSAVMNLWVSTVVCSCRRWRLSIVRPSPRRVSALRPPLKKMRMGARARSASNGVSGGGGGDGDASSVKNNWVQKSWCNAHPAPKNVDPIAPRTNPRTPASWSENESHVG